MGQMRVDRQLLPDLLELRLGVSPVLGHRLADQPDVEVEADVGNVAGLLAAEQVARARISRSFIAMAMPPPRSECWARVASRSCAVSVKGLSSG